MTRQRYGFVFGCNMFLALLIETILTAVVVDENGLGVDGVTQVRTDLLCLWNTLLSSRGQLEHLSYLSVCRIWVLSVAPCIRVIHVVHVYIYSLGAGKNQRNIIEEE